VGWETTAEVLAGLAASVRDRNATRARSAQR
jgi:hypothetical protein